MSNVDIVDMALSADYTVAIHYGSYVREHKAGFGGTASEKIPFLFFTNPIGLL